MRTAPANKPSRKSAIPAAFGIPGMLVMGVGIYAQSVYAVIIGAVMMIIALIPILAKGTRP